MEELRNYCREVISKYPLIREEVEDLYTLCMTEIEDGGSTTHEIELCMSDIQELINDLNLP